MKRARACAGRSSARREDGSKKWKQTTYLVVCSAIVACRADGPGAHVAREEEDAAEELDGERVALVGLAAHCGSRRHEGALASDVGHGGAQLLDGRVEERQRPLRLDAGQGCAQGPGSSATGRRSQTRGKSTHRLRTWSSGRRVDMLNLERRYRRRHRRTSCRSRPRGALPAVARPP